MAIIPTTMTAVVATAAVITVELLSSSLFSELLELPKKDNTHCVVMELNVL